MRVLVINPNSTHYMTDDIGRSASAAVGRGTAVDAVTAESSVPSIESFAEDIVASAEAVSAVLARRGEFDAVVSACAYDPAVYGLRELLDVPVVGILEAAALYSRVLAPSFSVITVLPRGVVHIEEVLKRLGLERQCKSVIGVDLGVLDLEQDRAGSLAVMQEACRLAIDRDGAESIVLGCAGMGYYERSLAEVIDVPVLDGVACATSLAESCVRIGVTTSKVRTFARPPVKDHKQMSGLAAKIHAI